ncbi:MAG: ion transporter [Chloroflexota bacterium]|nr:ion transporter [Chloroflexota bacterium]
MAATPTPKPHEIRQARRQLLLRLTVMTERPLIVLSFVWLALLVLDLTNGLPPVLQAVSTAIWIVFILDFIVKLLIAPDKVRYLRHNWLTVLALVLPALRVLRVARVVQLLRVGRAARTVNLLRMLTSLNRGTRALQRTVGQHGLLYLVPLTLIVPLVGAGGIAQFENPAAVHAQYPAAAPGTGIPSYGEAIWWTAMILTTFGSDYWPQTVAGRLVCWALSLYALGVFGYITATLASHFIGTTKPERAAAADPLIALHGELAALGRQIAELRAQLPPGPAPAEDAVAHRPATDSPVTPPDSTKRGAG